jgi:amino-acid N-acetyltransferase
MIAWLLLQQVDYGFSGEVRRVEVDKIMDRLIAGDVVHLTCLGFSPSGQVFNVDTEDLARVCAIKVSHYTHYHNYLYSMRKGSQLM